MDGESRHVRVNVPKVLESAGTPDVVRSTTGTLPVILLSATAREGFLGNKQSGGWHRITAASFPASHLINIQFSHPRRGTVTGYAAISQNTSTLKCP